MKTAHDVFSYCNSNFRFGWDDQNILHDLYYYVSKHILSDKTAGRIAEYFGITYCYEE